MNHLLHNHEDMLDVATTGDTHQTSGLACAVALGLVLSVVALVDLSPALGHAHAFGAGLDQIVAILCGLPSLAATGYHAFRAVVRKNDDFRHFCSDVAGIAIPALIVLATILLVTPRAHRG